MIFDREGDLVMTETGTMLDVGGFLMRPTREELLSREEALCLLWDRACTLGQLLLAPIQRPLPQPKRNDGGWLCLPEGVKLEFVGEDWDGTIRPVTELSYQEVAVRFDGKPLALDAPANPG